LGTRLTVALAGGRASESVDFGPIAAEAARVARRGELPPSDDPTSDGATAEFTPTPRRHRITSDSLLVRIAQRDGAGPVRSHSCPPPNRFRHGTLAGPSARIGILDDSLPYPEASADRSRNSAQVVIEA
jgi:hypothetical protein